MLTEFRSWYIGLAALVIFSATHSFREPCYGNPPSLGAVAGRPYTVEDLLRQEDWGKALIDSKGRWLVYEQTPPYNQRSDFAMERGTGTAQIMIADLDAPLVPKPLIEPASTTQYRLVSFSPDGGRLAIYRIKHGETRLVICEIQSRKLVLFKEVPDISDYEPKVIWVSSDEIVFAAGSNSREPFLYGGRRYETTHLFAARKKSWSGKEVSVTETVSSPGQEGESSRDGLLLKADARTGITSVLARGRFSNLKASADGRFVAGLRRDVPGRLSPDQLYDAEVMEDRFRLMIFDLVTPSGQTVADHMNVLDGSLAWSPTREELAFFAWHKDTGRENGLFYSFDTHAGLTKAWPHTGLELASRSYFPRRPIAVWLDDRLAVAARVNADRSGTPRLAESSTARPGKIDWYLLSRSGAPANLTKEFTSVSLVPISVKANGTNFWADGNLWRINPDGTKRNISGDAGLTLTPAGPRSPFDSSCSDSSPLLSKEQGESKYFLFDFNDNGHNITFANPSEGAVLMTCSVSAGAGLFSETLKDGAKRLLLQRGREFPTEIARLNQHLSTISKSEQKIIRYKDKNGRELQATVMLPRGYTTQRRFPVIVDIYPDRPRPTLRSQIGENFSFYTHDLLAAKGYIVLFPATPRDLYRTKDGPASLMSEVVLQGVDALVEQGYADPGRVGLIGFSQGGFSSLLVATQTDRFKAVVSINGWADPASHYFDAYSYGLAYPEKLGIYSMARYELSSSQFGFGHTPWQNSSAYFSNSPLYRADKIKTPILLVHSDMDGFGGEQYEMMFTALYRLSKEARLIRYWGEGHGPSSPANIRDLWYRTFAWFDEWGDISRDKRGDLVWDGDKVKSRNGARALKPEDFARFDEMILKKQ
ncbi:MAG TPA: prolyl oligopeptidase family serine peptidase [Pyrinomonadaceae bacterium]|nr:prolyl oligopeptidase family serine peptidase [Pyrinomonadaceae bacterium]